MFIIQFNIRFLLFYAKVTMIKCLKLGAVKRYAVQVGKVREGMNV